ncbi:hypothetical protein SAMN05444395_10694 [Flavobacterium fryxellicola]|nr:hypothetical protein SAMN05444395_10694 [Flavobacterium fryxellicola]
MKAIQKEREEIIETYRIPFELVFNLHLLDS